MNTTILVSLKKFENFSISSEDSLILEMNGFVHEQDSVVNSLMAGKSALRFSTFSSSLMKDKVSTDNGLSLEITISLVW